MRWPPWRRLCRDTTDEARKHKARLEAQQTEVDRLTQQLERRRESNNFRAAVEDVFRGTP